MARPRKTTLPDQLAAAADRLEALGEPELAEAVREALAKLTAPKASPDNPTLPLYVRKETWERVQAAGTTTDAVEDGFNALLAGRFIPTEQPRGGGKGKYSSRVSVRLKAEVEAYVTAHADELGWTPSPSQVANAWLEHKYGKRARR